MTDGFEDRWEAWEADPDEGQYYEAKPHKLSSGLRRIALLAYEWGRDDHSVKRDNDLRRQAEATCDRRTIELEDARTALARQAEDAELGRAMRELAAQVTRLRRTPGLPFDFTPGGVAQSVTNELFEVRREAPGSPATHRELGDLISTVVSLFGSHGAPLLTTTHNATSKLKRRLDLVAKGATWEQAKSKDKSHKRVEDCEIIGEYMPPFPGPDTRPTMVVQHKPSGMFLRYSNGPLQGHFWDMYGDDYQEIEVATEAIKWACANEWTDDE